MVSSSTNYRNRLMQRYRNHSDIDGPDFAGCDGDLRRFHTGQRRTRTSRLRKKTCASTSNLKCETHSGRHRSTRNQRSRSNWSAETHASDTDNDDEVFPCTRYRNRRMLRWCSSSLWKAPGRPTLTARDCHHGLCASSAPARPLVLAGTPPATPRRGTPRCATSAARLIPTTRRSPRPALLVQQVTQQRNR